MYKYLFIKETKDTIVILFVVLILGSVVSERGVKGVNYNSKREGIGNNNNNNDDNNSNNNDILDYTYNSTIRMVVVVVGCLVVVLLLIAVTKAILKLLYNQVNSNFHLRS